MPGLKDQKPQRITQLKAPSFKHPFFKSPPSFKHPFLKKPYSL